MLQPQRPDILLLRTQRGAVARSIVVIEVTEGAEADPLRVLLDQALGLCSSSRMLCSSIRGGGGGGKEALQTSTRTMTRYTLVSPPLERRCRRAQVIGPGAGEIGSRVTQAAAIGEQHLVAEPADAQVEVATPGRGVAPCTSVLLPLIERLGK